MHSTKTCQAGALFKVKVQISQPYRYANTARVRFSCGIFSMSVTVNKRTDIVKGAREFAERLRRYKKNPIDYAGLPYPRGI